MPREHASKITVKDVCPTCFGTGRIVDHIAVGEEAQHIRTRSKCPQKAVAKAMGITASYLCDLEQGRRKWTLDLWKQMLTACGIKP